MKNQTQNLPGLSTGPEVITCRGHELRHLQESLAAQSKRILTMTAVCQSSYRCVIGQIPPHVTPAALPLAQDRAACACDTIHLRTDSFRRR